MQKGQSTSAADNLYYDLVSTLHNSLKAEQAYSTYSKDAQANGNKELATFFQQLCQQSKQCAEQTRQILERQQTKH